jgi:competence protein ComFC
MRCLVCQSLCLNIICKSCQSQFLQPSFYKRALKDDFYVYSFYSFEDIQELINAKYYFFGDRIYNVLAKNSFGHFAKNFNFTQSICAIPIDDHTRDQFSQTAILAHHLKSNIIKPYYNTLKATNIVKFAGKDLKFRQTNKRNFIYKGKQNIKTILVDDIVTTGTTILEAKEVLEKNNCEVLFALTLADVSNK